MGRPKSARITKICEACAASFDVTSGKAQQARRFCSKACSNRATAEQRAASVRARGQYSPPVCPCGSEVPPPSGQRWVYASQKKYCSAECRSLYGKKRQPDLKNYVTFDCETCGESTTKYRMGGKKWRFCSNECAAKHTKKVRHIGVRDSDVVLDSGWEALLWGLCAFLKVPAERVDRRMAVPIGEGWYAPDFVIAGHYVEVKGLEEDDDPERWRLWAEQHGPVIVVDRDRLNRLRCCQTAEDFKEALDGDGVRQG